MKMTINNKRIREKIASFLLIKELIKGRSETKVSAEKEAFALANCSVTVDEDGVTIETNCSYCGEYNGIDIFEWTVTTKKSQQVISVEKYMTDRKLNKINIDEFEYQDSKTR